MGLIFMCDRKTDYQETHNPNEIIREHPAVLAKVMMGEFGVGVVV